jgi:UTP--glucose-1-phosphate uridylyltransferase
LPRWSTLGVVGRYILQPEIMPILAEIGEGAGGEIQLTDGMAALIGEQPLHAVTFDGERHDCGDARGFVLANLALALKRDDLAGAVRAWLDRA